MNITKRFHTDGKKLPLVKRSVMLKKNEMKFVTWNCKGAYRKKHLRLIESYDPDIWVIQECEHPDKFKKEKGFTPPENIEWYGDNLNRGVGIFSKPGISLRIAKTHNKNYRYIIPVRVSGKYELNLFAVWAMNDTANKKQRYIGQVFSSLEYYKNLFNHSTIFAGDFNWNVSFKAGGKLTGDLIDVINFLAKANIKSAYHSLRNEEFGKESHPTLYFRGQHEKPFHIDYIFLSDSLLHRAVIDVGEWADWYLMSDHMPLLLKTSKA